MNKFIFYCIILICVASCKPTKEIIYITKDQEKIHRDSIYFYDKDSIYIREKGDTVLIKEYVFRYRNIHITDTVIKNDTIVMEKERINYVEVEKHLKWYEKILYRAGNIALVILSGLIIFFIIKNIFKRFFFRK